MNEAQDTSAAPADTGERPAPTRGLGTDRSYSVPRAQAPIDLRLDANEGPALAKGGPPLRDLTGAIERYPNARSFERQLAGRFGLAAEQVLVTAGADDALLRACLAYLEPGREIVLPEPAFEMIPRYAKLAGARIRGVPDNNPRYPVEAVLRAIEAAGEQLGVVAVVSPSNPTGSVASAADLRAISDAARGALVLADLAYAEFADEDLTATALQLPNVVCVRTLSKAWGLAGARVGWAMGPEALIAPMRGAGNPYAVSAPSLRLAIARLEFGEADMRRYVDRVSVERATLSITLRGLGCTVRPSQANFVLCELESAERALVLRDALAGLGIAVRAFPGRPGLERAVRITCPGNARTFERLSGALRAALAPRTLLIDRDLTGSLDSASKTRLAERLPLAPFSARTRPDIDCAWALVDRPVAVNDAREAGIVPIAWTADDALGRSLLECGAARVVSNLEDLERMLP